MRTAVATNGGATRLPLKVHGSNGGVVKPAVPPEPTKVAPQTASANGPSEHLLNGKRPRYRLASDLSPGQWSGLGSAYPTGRIDRRAG